MILVYVWLPPPLASMPTDVSYVACRNVRKHNAFRPLLFHYYSGIITVVIYEFTGLLKFTYIVHADLLK